MSKEQGTGFGAHYRFSANALLFWATVWTVVGVVLARIESADALRAGFTGAPWEPWCWAFSASYSFAAIAPAIAACCHRWPLDRDHLPSTIVRLLALYIPTALVFTTLMLGVRHVVYLVVTGDLYPINDVIDRYVYEFPKSVLLYFVVVFVTYARLYQQRAAQEQLAAAQLREALSNARLKALQGQLQPHFLFNTLNLISSRMYQSPEVADSIMTRLADLLRYSLKAQDQTMVTLDAELEAAESYLTIARLRFEQRLTCNLRIAPQTRSLTVPALLLQPLLENAVKHGIEPSAGGGSVSIETSMDAAQLKIIVRNPRSATSSEQESFGLGLSNTRERLHMIYGAEASLELNATGEDITTTVMLPATLADS